MHEHCLGFVQKPKMMTQMLRGAVFCIALDHSLSPTERQCQWWPLGQYRKDYGLDIQEQVVLSWALYQSRHRCCFYSPSSSSLSYSSWHNLVYIFVVDDAVDGLERRHQRKLQYCALLSCSILADPVLPR